MDIALIFSLPKAYLQDLVDLGKVDYFVAKFVCEMLFCCYLLGALSTHNLTAFPNSKFCINFQVPVYIFCAIIVMPIQKVIDKPKNVPAQR